MTDEFISNSQSQASNRLVLLHGWGADAEDLMPLGSDLIHGLEPSFELISLRAPNEHPQGVGRQWYGLFPPDWPAAVLAISDLVGRLKTLESPRIPLRKTFLLGFSQGGAMALAAGCDLPLAGLICCSGYQHPGWVPPAISPPVLLSHGKNDEIVPFEASRQIFSSLSNKSIESDLILFDGGHEIPRELVPRFRKALHSWCV